jgi:hypothetical protein
MVLIAVFYKIVRLLRHLAIQRLLILLVGDLGMHRLVLFGDLAHSLVTSRTPVIQAKQ